MVNIKIDGIDVSVPEGTTIMQAASKIDKYIPKLCYLKDINEIAACRVCLVELEGMDKLITSCNNTAKEGMVIYTNTPKVRMARKNNVQFILSQHDFRCATCVRSGSCMLQKLSNDLNIVDMPFKQRYEENRWDTSYPFIKEASKCIKCMRCIQICDKVQGLNIWDVTSTGSRTTVATKNNKDIKDLDCSQCGQCVVNCPVGALRERDDTELLWDSIADNNKVVVAQVAPAVRTAWGDWLGMPRQQATMGKITDALKKLGVDYVFDTTFSADLTIMEEANEFIQRFTSGELKDRPMFTSCCPAWVRFLKSQYPHMVKQLSSAKSPQQMFGAVMKTYFAQKIGVKPENIVTVSIMPCIAKKGEREMEFYYEEYAGHEVDIVLTTREFVRMIREANIHPSTLKDVECDSLMKHASGAGVIFGVTGGVMEAALRSAYYFITGENPDANLFKMVRNTSKNLTEAKLKIGDVEVNIAVVSGLSNARKLLESIQAGESKYDFVEVMSCPNGCINGGGQTILDDKSYVDARSERLYFLDENSDIRFSHENPDIKQLYSTFLEKPLSHTAHMLLHTEHSSFE